MEWPKKYRNIRGEILDIGSGSWILGLLLAREYTKLNLNLYLNLKRFWTNFEIYTFSILSLIGGIL